jgi:hypothetical protein
MSLERSNFGPLPTWVRSTKSSIAAPQARVTPDWFFCGQSAVRSLSQSVSP